MTAPAVSTAARRLLDAARSGVPCPPVRDLIGADDVAASYAVQREVTRERLAAGARVVGWKVGLTSAAVQRQLGVGQPDFGMLFDDMEASSTGEVDTARLLQPRIEAEIAFVLGARLDGPGEFTPDRVRAAVAYQVAALEVVDSRIAGWDISIADTVADNASSGMFVLGRRQATPAAVPPVATVMELTRDGEVVSKGSGAACLGDPLAALAWLAGVARDAGEPLRAGQVVLSGALGPMVPLVAGATYTATVTGLGAVTAHARRGVNGDRGDDAARTETA
ncbi:2-keto-4-pentenoate hydratase [Pseudosporangium ferrugineum]|nr:fumarylacetoacetate hydrolase family protein [Pseudosporangium ferrugineum]